MPRLQGQVQMRANLPAISSLMLRGFRRIVRRYFRRHFHTVRLSGAEELLHAPAGPLIVYANHSSWWDPMTCFLLSGELLPERRHYAPMDVEALERYSILKRLGIFPVEVGTRRGAVQFLRTAEAVLRAEGVLWMTPQGRFADVRERPLTFKAGLDALVTRVPQCTVLPLAVEYCFWDERKPESLILMGPAIVFDVTEAGVERQLEKALEATMEQLRVKVMARDAAGFSKTLARGRVGTGGVYGWLQRLEAFILRRPYREEHTEIATKDRAQRAGGVQR